MADERIVAAAVMQSGLVVTSPPPARHHSIMHPLFDLTGKTVSADDQGFITSAGRFVGRKEALRIADRQMQIIEKTGNQFELYSEDLW